MYSVLYVDDEPALLELGKLFLEQSGTLRIDTALSAPDAIKKLNNQVYDAIVSDYQMPEMDGIQFLKTLRAAGNLIPFIIFTGRGREDIVINALNSGADFYLQKGGDPASQFAELRNIVGKAVRQKSADEALRVSEGKYRTILENIQDVYYRSDLDGNLILASPSMLTVLGYDSLPELYGKNIARTIYYNPEQRNEFLAAINRSESVSNYEVTLKKRDGTPLFVLTSSHKYYDQSGTFQGVEGIFRDITERKKAEDELRSAYEQLTAFDEEMQAQFEEVKFGQEALRTSEKKLQGIVQGSPIPQFVIDKNHRVISWNNALEQYSGVKAEEVLGTNRQWRAFYPQERPCMADLLVDGAMDKIPEWYFGKYKKSKYVQGAYEATDFFPKMGPQGTWLYFTASALRDPQGTVIGAVETLEDISERKKGEDELRSAYEQLTAFNEEMQAQFEELKFGQEALRTSEKKLEGIVQGSPIPQFVIDKNHRVISWNNALEQYSGVKAEEVLGTNRQWRAFYPEERPCMADLLVDSAMDKIPEWYFGKYKKSKYVEGAYEATDFFPNMGPQGTWLFFTASALRDPQGTVIGAVETLEDITDIKVKEEALLASEEQYRNVVETQTEFICRFKPDGTHVFVNEAYCRYFKKTCPDFIGKKFRPEIPPEDQARIKKHFASLSYDHPVATIDHRIIMPDGTPRWQRWVDRAIFTDEGVLTEYQTVGRDITDLKNAEEKIQTMSRFQQGIIANANVWLMVLDHHGTILLWNNAAEEISSYPAHEVVGNNRIWALLYPDREYRKTITQTLLQIINERKFLQNFETTIRTKSGDKKTILWNTRGIAETGDRTASFVAIGIDITKSIRAEQALRESENKLSAILRGSPIPQFVIDRDHKVIQWNEALEKYSGISARDMLGTSRQWRAFYPEERPCMADLLVEGQVEKIHQWYSGKYTKSPLLNDAYDATDFFPHMGTSGTWLHFTAAPIRDDGGVIIGAVETLEDITERKISEEALYLANKKLNLLSGITRHDIRNQLLALEEYLEISRQYPGDPTRTAELIAKEERIARTIAHQIDFTRDYEDLGVKASAWQNVHRIIRNVIARLPVRDIRIDAGAPDLEILADPLLEKVFYNLIENALRYGGEQMTAIRVTNRKDNGVLVITVDDDGKGISADDKKKLFTKGFGRNTGLGLFLSREILSITGITITETGEPGKGARFEITVPEGAWRFFQKKG